MLNRYEFHPFLFSLLPILFLYQFNIHEIRADHVIVPIFASLGIVLVSWLILRFFTGKLKSGLFLSWFLILFSVHGNIHIVLLNYQNEILQLLGRNIILGPIFLGILVVTLMTMAKTIHVIIPPKM